MNTLSKTALKTALLLSLTLTSTSALAQSFETYWLPLGASADMTQCNHPKAQPGSGQQGVLAYEIDLDAYSPVTVRVEITSPLAMADEELVAWATRDDEYVPLSADGHKALEASWAPEESGTWTVYVAMEHYGCLDYRISLGYQSHLIHWAKGCPGTFWSQQQDVECVADAMESDKGNDTPTTATLLAVPSLVAGTLCEGDLDYFAVQLPLDCDVQVVLTSEAKLPVAGLSDAEQDIGDLTLEVLTPNGKTLSESSSDDTSETLTLPAGGGLVLIAVYGADDNQTAPYSLSLAPICGKPFGSHGLVGIELR